MKTKVSKWGNSLAIRLPSKLAMTHSLENGSELTISEDENGILLKPSKTQFDLDTLLSAISPENLHSPIDSDEAVGNEIW
jgi:antitoxin MazE